MHTKHIVVQQASSEPSDGCHLAQAVPMPPTRTAAPQHTWRLATTAAWRQLIRRQQKAAAAAAAGCPPQRRNSRRLLLAVAPPARTRRLQQTVGHPVSSSRRCRAHRKKKAQSSRLGHPQMMTCHVPLRSGRVGRQGCRAGLRGQHCSRRMPSKV
jgi:hypothetical protein